MNVEATRWLGRVTCSALVAVAACGGGIPGGGTTTGDTSGEAPATGDELLRHAEEIHLDDVRQLTRNQGENAEAYWSSSGRELIFQSKRAPYGCDQIFRVPADGSRPPELVSTGKGRTTCSYFFPGDQRILYSSTHLAGDACPPEPDHSQGYVWALYESYDIFAASADGTQPVRLTDKPGYDAEATVCSRDGSIVFTSTRDGDIELYRMDKDGKNVVRLTDAPGYDGGAFFSPDCSKIVWRASRPEGVDLEDYKGLLARGMVRPTRLELFVANADGTEAQQVTYLGAASFAPYFHPSGKRLLFSTNYPEPRGREFDIWAVDVDGTDLERITHAPGFDGFPMFSPDGKQLAFASNRNQAVEGQTDLYVATWVEGEPRGGSGRSLGNGTAGVSRAVVPTAADRYAADVAWLADDAREGRGVGTRGIDAAADWLAARMKEIGVEGGMDGDGYFQPLDVAVSLAVGGATSLTIGGQTVGAGDFEPLGFSAAGKASGRTVFVGHGVSAPDLGHDDWGKKKLAGKIAVVKRFVPKSKAFMKPEDELRHGDIHRKAVLARQHGARGLIVVDVPPAGAEEAALPALRASDVAKEVGIPVVAVKRVAGQKLLTGSSPVTIQVALESATRPTRNVVGVVRTRAKDAMPGVVVVGAHYDHLGRGGEHSLEPSQSGVHNGADDNASGTAALLEIGRTLVARRDRLKRDVYLVAFTAEEGGLVGSKHFVAHLPGGMKPADVTGMINLDMVGRMRGNRLVISATDTAAEWRSMIGPACREARISCVEDPSGGWGPSDHSSFFAEKIPVLFFFTGPHPEYHKTSDDSELINAGGGAQIAAAAAEVAMASSAMVGSLTYRPSAPAAPRGGDRRSFGASLGTIPDYTNQKPGMLLDGVRAGGPAEEAGLKRGDRIIAIDDVELRSVQEMVYVLQDARPGQTARLTIERDGKRIVLKATYGKGRGGPTSGSGHPPPASK